MKTLTNTPAATPQKTLTVGWLAAWTVASALGFALGVLGTLQIIWSLGENATNSIPAPVQGIIGGGILGLGIALATGLAQWFVLRARGESTPRWLISTCLGGIVGGIVIGGLLFGQPNSGSNPVLVIGGFAVLGAAVGGFNYLMARPVVGSIAWILASALGFACAAAILFGMSNQDIAMVSGIGGSLVYGIITAAAFWWHSSK